MTRLRPRPFVVVALIVTAAAAVPARADAPVSPTLGVSVTLLDQPRARPWAIDLAVAADFPTADGTRPSPLRHARFRFPQATVNARDFPTCSPAALERSGPRVCPARSRVGSGEALVDVRPVITNLLHAKIDVFNGTPARGRPRFLFAARGVELPDVTVYLRGTLSRAPGRFGYALDLEVPPLKTVPGVPEIAIDHFEVSIGARIRHRGRLVSLLEAPTRCPREGWPFDMDASFADGQRHAAAARIACTLRATPG